MREGCGETKHTEHTIHLHSPNIIITIWEIWTDSAALHIGNKKLEIFVGTKGSRWAEEMQPSSWGAEKCSSNKSFKKTPLKTEEY